MKKPLRLCAWTLVTATLCLSSAAAHDYFWDEGPGPFPQPPTNETAAVQIVFPHSGSMILVGTDTHICAETEDFTDKVATVEFFAGTTSLGVVSNSFDFWDENRGFFCFTWSNPPAGAYTLTAVATDMAGNSATSPGVNIAVVTDLPPRIHIVEPEDGSFILGPTDIQICAEAFDPDGTVTNVEIFEGNTSLGTATSQLVYITNEHGIFPLSSPYCLTWSNAPLGSFTLTAVATDNGGAASTSAPVTINVVTDLPPVVHIESPDDDRFLTEPATIMICAEAHDPDGTVTSVEFFSGSNSLGVVTTPVMITNWWHVETLYCLTLSNLTAGTYVITAVATDNGGATGVSQPVTITVNAPLPPSVRIVTPRDGATIYNAPTDIHVCAFECNFTNPIVNVEFLADAVGLGSSSNSPFSCIVWSQAPPGGYTLTAVATDSGGNSVTSAPVNIMVSTNPPPRHRRDE